MRILKSLCLTVAFACALLALTPIHAQAQSGSEYCEGFSCADAPITAYALGSVPTCSGLGGYRVKWVIQLCDGEDDTTITATDYYNNTVNFVHSGYLPVPPYWAQYTGYTTCYSSPPVILRISSTQGHDVYSVCGTIQCCTE